MAQDFGKLTVRTYTAGGGLPVAQALVRVSGAEEINRFVNYTLLTDIDGSTKSVSLPAPKRSNSLSPNSNGESFALYNVEVNKDGYYTKNVYGLEIFSGVTTILPVNMIPVSDMGESEFPRGSIDTVIPDNSNL